MRILLPLLLLTLTACTPDATRVRIVNTTSFNLLDGELAFGGETESINRLSPGEESGYFRFDGADDCDRTFTGRLEGFGEVTNNAEPCTGPLPLLPGKYSLTLRFEPTLNADGTSTNSIFLRLSED